MISANEHNTQSKTFQKILFLIVCAALIFARRPMELLAPYVWQEDGIVNIPHYIEAGVWSLFEPVQGYLILPAKLINIIALKMSFLYYPEISMYMSFCFSLYCLYMIAYSPTQIKYPLLCAFSILLIPTDAEVFILPLYSFWWGTLLLFLAALWNNEGKSHFSHMTCTIIGGFSSPLSIVVFPIFIIRYFYNRKKQELHILLIAAVPAIIQGCLVFTSAKMESINLNYISLMLPEIFNKFIVYYFWKAEIGKLLDILLIFTLFSFLIYCVLKSESYKKLGFLILLTLLFLTIFISIKRVPIEIIDPYLAGQRYFFYPYIIISWLLIWLLHDTNQPWIKFGIIALLLFTAVNSVMKYSRTSESPNWRKAVWACVNQEQQSIPIQTDGTLNNLWELQVSPTTCKLLIKSSLFDNLRNFETKMQGIAEPLYSYSKFSSLPLSSINILKGEFKLGSVPPQVNFPYKERFLGSWVGGDAFTGKSTIGINAKGTNTVFEYVTGPISKNQIITVSELDTGKVIFSIPLEKSEWPKRFGFLSKENFKYQLDISDNGSDWGEWSAVYIPE